MSDKRRGADSDTCNVSIQIVSTCPTNDSVAVQDEPSLDRLQFMGLGHEHEEVRLNPGAWVKGTQESASSCIINIGRMTMRPDLRGISTALATCHIALPVRRVVSDLVDV